MAKKRVAAIVKIQIPAGAATPAPPVGTALGPHGVNIMDFCKMYNAQTESQRGTVIPVEITIFEDRSFTFITKTPPTPVLLRAAAGIDKGAQTTGPRDRRAPITDAQLDRDRADEDARPQRQRPRGGQEAGGGHRPLDGDQGAADDGPRESGTPTPSRHFDRQQDATRPAEAVDLVKSMAAAKFDETVELAVRLGVDPRKADQIVRGTVGLPGGHRQGRAGRGLRRRRRRGRGPRRRRRHRGRRRPGREGAGRLPRLRRRHRHPRPDGAGRQARPGARAPRA